MDRPGWLRKGAPRRGLALASESSPVLLAGSFGLAVLSLAGLLVARGRVPFTSDQAIPALMAKDIAAGAAKPVFYYGVEYGGAAETYLLAAVFRLLGPSTQAYRAVLAVFLLAIVLGLWRTATIAAGRRAGALVGGVTAFGPADPARCVARPAENRHRAGRHAERAAADGFRPGVVPR